MKTSKKCDGYSLIEMFVVIQLVVIGAVLCPVVMGNFWVGEVSALRAIKQADPTMVELVMLERRILYSSLAVARDKDRQEKTFLLDANILNRVVATLEED